MKKILLGILAVFGVAIVIIGARFGIFAEEVPVNGGDWNYKIDLKWDVENPDEYYQIENVATSNDKTTVKYKLDIATQKDYEIGKIEIRVPRALFRGDQILPSSYSTTTTKPIPSRISVADESAPTASMSYTYRIDKKGTGDTADDDLIFYNYKKVEGSQNSSIVVEYVLGEGGMPMYGIRDDSVGTIIASASAQHNGQNTAETQTSREISYNLDTGIKGLTVGKSYHNTTTSLIYYWDSSLYGNKPADFDTTQYNYVFYSIAPVLDNPAQINHVEFAAAPSHNGEIVQIGNHSNMQIDKIDGKYVWKTSDSISWDDDYNYYRVIVRYPRTNEESPTYKLDISAKAVANNEHDGDKTDTDLNDISTATYSTSIRWKDYKFSFSGREADLSKHLRSYYYSNYIDKLARGDTLKFESNPNLTIQGYNHDYFNTEIVDNQMSLKFAYTDSGEDVKPYQVREIPLDETNMEIVGQPYISLSAHNIDRNTGEVISNADVVKDYKFTFWAQKGKKGAWEELYTCTPSSAESKCTMPNDLTGQGYTGIRLTTSDNLKDYVNIRLNFDFNVDLSESDTQWVKDNYNKIIVSGIDDSLVINTANSSTKFNDANALIEASNIGTIQLAKNSKSSNILKNCDIPTYNYSTQYTHISCSTYEYQRVNDISFLTEEEKNEMEQRGGTLYDLLPFGYELDREKNITWNYYGFSGAKNVAPENITLIENYRGSGRQMLIIKVESDLAVGGNFYDSSTGFRIHYSMKAPFLKSALMNPLYNNIAFQRDDLAEMPSSSNRFALQSEAGPTGFSDQAKQWPNDSDGKNLFYDINGDGKVDPDLNNTLYASAKISSDYLMAAEVGITKKVRGNEAKFDKEATTDAGAIYDYQLSLVTEKNSNTSNVVLYDILEEAENVDGFTGEKPSWKGELISVDADIARAYGVEPVVWYSTAKNLNYLDSNNLLIEKKPDIWSQTPPADMSDVTAIAIDLRKDSTGKDFVFVGQSTIDFSIKMKAPEQLSAEVSDYAYNRPAYNSTLKPIGSPTEATSFNINSRTRIKMNTTRVPVEIIWDDQENDAGLRPEKVALEIFANGEKIDRTIDLSADNDWKAVFENLPASKNNQPIVYTVREISPPEDYTVRNSGDQANGYVFEHKYSPKPEIPEIPQNLENPELTPPIKKAKFKLIAPNTSFRAG